MALGNHYADQQGDAMRIAAITRFKHGQLFQLLKELGWSYKEFSRRSGISYGSILQFLSLTKRPNEKFILKMEMAFGEAGKFVDVAAMFPDSYIGFKRPLQIVQVQDVEPQQLEWFRQSQINLLEDAQPPVASDLLDTQEKLDTIATFLDKVDSPLTEQERDMIEMHFIKGIDYRTIASKHGFLHGESARQVINRGLGKMRDYFEQRDNPYSFLNVATRVSQQQHESTNNNSK